MGSGNGKPRDSSREQRRKVPGKGNCLNTKPSSPGSSAHNSHRSQKPQRTHHLRQNTKFKKSVGRKGKGIDADSKDGEQVIASTIILQIMSAFRVPSDKSMLAVQGFIERELKNYQDRSSLSAKGQNSLSVKDRTSVSVNARIAPMTKAESKAFLGSITTWAEKDLPKERLETFDSNIFRTPHRHPSSDPVWNYTIDLQIPAVEGDILHLAITKGSGTIAIGAFNLNNLPKDDIITGALCPVTKKELSTDRLISDMKKLDDSKATLLKFKIISKLKLSSRLYFVRHGESKWNQARKERNYRKLIHFDHILTYEGIRQSRKLREKWMKAKLKPEMENDPDIDAFMNADQILCSPLTRAVQTCLLALQDHPTALKRGIKLCRDLREIKSLGGFDAKGKCFGSAIIVRAEEKLKKKVKEALEANCDTPEKIKDELDAVSRACGTKIDVNDANSQWWVLKDTKFRVEERLDDFMSYIRYCRDETFICFGHSMFLKAFFSRCLNPKWETLNPEIALKLKTEKLSNAGVVRVDISFKGKDSNEWVITDVRLVFNTSFQLRHPERSTPQPSEPRKLRGMIRSCSAPSGTRLRLIAFPAKEDVLYKGHSRLDNTDEIHGKQGKNDHTGSSIAVD
mmetsp:Transcript_25492/g.61407  ORF Transcript_25492/g.61407 Transcript_25492/m.61407 type:complete len:626 (-) Transcript_25492:201-2078(-)|eukprot:CAMPEP_0114505376 /NCGR_PEP_ID=MMETSP0109-20121206/10822_1 /TAXON_ID=29199 /ORGANISM="Chlorarachnion reptans, Strain CCCM449" /LENGTH=625 /DNA_ID=CAMNT_0001683815 /DNA_START=316 /DNA_END=2193 /DNA_ORIENTATION=+